MKYTHLLLVVFLIGPLLSFGQYYYAPNEGLLSGLKEKNEVNLSLAAGSNTISGKLLSYQIGYSPVKYLGIQSSYSSLKIIDIKTDELSHQSYTANAAIGTYYFLSLKKANAEPTPVRNKYAMTPGILADLYVGYGKGKVTNYHTPLIRSELDLEKTFIQGGLHWQGKIIGLGFVTKAGLINYQSAVVSGSKGQPISEVNNVVFYNSYNFIENSLRLKLGLRHVQLFFTQTWLTISYRDKVSVIDNAYNFGAAFKLSDLFKKKTK